MSGSCASSRPRDGHRKLASGLRPGLDPNQHRPFPHRLLCEDIAPWGL